MQHFFDSHFHFVNLPSRPKENFMKPINYIIIILLILHLPQHSFSQASDSLDLTCGINVVNYAMLDQEPVFEGGQQAMYLWMAQNIRYPATAREFGIQGKVFLSFIVDTAGYISCVKIVRGIQSDLNQEAIDLVSAMPRWTPGIKDGIKVSTRLVMPITFSLGQPGNPDDSYQKFLEEANSYLEQEQYQLSIKSYNKVLNRDPENIDALFNRSIAKRKLGDLKGACDDLKKAASLGDHEASILSDSLCSKRK
jgi:TonB family protein